jgi:hypothetical protein
VQVFLDPPSAEPVLVEAAGLAAEVGDDWGQVDALQTDRSPYPDLGLVKHTSFLSGPLQSHATLGRTSTDEYVRRGERGDTPTGGRCRHGHVYRRRTRVLNHELP